MSQLKRGNSKKKSSPPPKAKVIEHKIDYVVLDCGYTSRLVEYYVKRGAQIQVKAAKKKAIDGSRVADHNLSASILENAEMLCEEHDCSKGCDKKWGRSYVYGYANGDEQDEVVMPIIINDSLYGDGLYLFRNSDDELAEAAFIANVLNEAKCSSDIVFKCSSHKEAFNIAYYVKLLQHCACFNDVFDMKFVEKNTGNGNGITINIMILSYDTESG
jgi:hypothetical protein